MTSHLSLLNFSLALKQAVKFNFGVCHLPLLGAVITVLFDNLCNRKSNVTQKITGNSKWREFCVSRL